MLVFIGEFPFWVNNILSFGLGILLYMLFIILCSCIALEIFNVDDNIIDNFLFLFFFAWIINPIAQGCEYIHYSIIKYLNNKKLNDFRLAAEYEDKLY